MKTHDLTNNDLNKAPGSRLFQRIFCLILLASMVIGCGVTSLSGSKTPPVPTPTATVTPLPTLNPIVSSFKNASDKYQTVSGVVIEDFPFREGDLPQILEGETSIQEALGQIKNLVHPTSEIEKAQKISCTDADPWITRGKSEVEIALLPNAYKIQIAACRKSLTDLESLADSDYVWWLRVSQATAWFMMTAKAYHYSRQDAGFRFLDRDMMTIAATIRDEILPEYKANMSESKLQADRVWQDIYKKIVENPK